MVGNFDAHKWFKNQYLTEDTSTLEGEKAMVIQQIADEMQNLSQSHPDELTHDLLKKTIMYIERLIQSDF